MLTMEGEVLRETHTSPVMLSHLSGRRRCWTRQPASWSVRAPGRSRSSGRRSAPRSRRVPAGLRRSRRRRTRVPALQTHTQSEAAELWPQIRAVVGVRNQPVLIKVWFRPHATSRTFSPFRAGKMRREQVISCLTSCQRPSPGDPTYLWHRWASVPSAWSPGPAGPSCCCRTWRASRFLRRKQQQQQQQLRINQEQFYKKSKKKSVYLWPRHCAHLHRRSSQERRSSARTHWACRQQTCSFQTWKLHQTLQKTQKHGGTPTPKKTKKQNRKPDQIKKNERRKTTRKEIHLLFTLHLDGRMDGWHLSKIRMLPPVFALGKLSSSCSQHLNWFKLVEFN